MHEIDAWPQSSILRYQDYVARHLLPSRVQQLYLAQIAMMTCRSGGGNAKLGLDDFMIKLNPVAVEQDTAVDDGEKAVHPLAALRGRRKREQQAQQQ